MVTIRRDSDHENNLIRLFCNHRIEHIEELGCKELNPFPRNAQMWQEIEA